MKNEIYLFRNKSVCVSYVCTLIALEPEGLRNLLKVKVKSLRVFHFVTPWSLAHQAPPSMGFSRQEYWSGLPFPAPRDLPDPGIEPNLPHCA